jgi:hypothetical protein
MNRFVRNDEFLLISQGRLAAPRRDCSIEYPISIVTAVFMAFISRGFTAQAAN